MGQSREALTADEVAALLREYGHRLALRGGNPYRAKAYRTAAEEVAGLGEALDDLVRRGELTTIPGVGEAIAPLITRLYTTGTDPKLQDMRREIPASVLELVSLPGIRADQILKIYKETGIDSLEALEMALRSGTLAGRKGFSAAFQAKLLDRLKILREQSDALHIHRGWALAERACETLRTQHPDVTDVMIAGECRRQCELIHKIVIVAVDPRGSPTREITVGRRATARLCAAERFGATLLFATGAPAHIEALCEVAERAGMTLTPEGLQKGSRIIAATTEADVYAALDLPFIPPELREGRDEFEIARRTPALVRTEDVKGILHAHTDQSDGVATLADMAEATSRAGYQYLGLTDHSQSAHYAGGLKVDEIRAQQREADRLNRRYGSDFHIFKGIESDIKPDGSLDYPESVLRDFDFIIASVHGQFRMDRKAQTARIIKAIESPYTTILGHMTGRQLLRRNGYETDIEAILQACAEHGVAVEINANPWRLDLDWRWHQLALKHGCLMSINPDAHSVREIDLLHWGVAMARKGGVPADRVLSCLDRDAFADHIAKRKAAAVRRNLRQKRAATRPARPKAIQPKIRAAR